MRSRLIPEYPRETVDFIPFVDLLLNGVPVTNPADLEYAVTAEFARPTAWAPADSGSGAAGFILNGPVLGPGVHKVFVRPAAGTTKPEIEAGQFRLT